MATKEVETNICGTVGSFLVRSLVVPSVLSFSVRRGANPAGVRSLGGQGVGVGVHGIAACNGGLCVGERKVLVSAVGSVVPIPDSERATGAVLLGPGVSSGGLSTSERRRRSQLLAVTWFLLPGVVVGYFFVGSIVVSRELRIGERKAVEPVVGNGLGGTSLKRKVLGAAGCTGGDVAAAATTHLPFTNA
ncbi:hypothetical protein ACOSQ2_005458 [Xanthoceras sorbifolium]